MLGSFPADESTWMQPDSGPKGCTDITDDSGRAERKSDPGPAGCTNIQIRGKSRSKKAKNSVKVRFQSAGPAPMGGGYYKPPASVTLQPASVGLQSVPAVPLSNPNPAVPVSNDTWDWGDNNCVKCCCCPCLCLKSCLPTGATKDKDYKRNCYDYLAGTVAFACAGGAAYAGKTFSHWLLEWNSIDEKDGDTYNNQKSLIEDGTLTLVTEEDGKTVLSQAANPLPIVLGDGDNFDDIYRNHMAWGKGDDEIGDGRWEYAMTGCVVAVAVLLFCAVGFFLLCCQLTYAWWCYKEGNQYFIKETCKCICPDRFKKEWITNQKTPSSE